MSPDRWPVVKEILAEALEQEPGLRRQWVRKRCGNDSEMLAEIEALLDSESQMEGFLLSPAEALPTARESSGGGFRLEEGDVFGQYRISGFLGEGGMGKVFLAEDIQLSRPVALKFLSPRLGSDTHHARRLLREARAAAALDHPYICKVYETGEIDGKPFIAMEYVEGETIRERAARSPIPVAQAIAIATEVAEALEVAHQKGIVHRDLKPDNILLTPQGHVKVMDFGLAKRMPPAQAGPHEGQSLADTQVSGEYLAGSPAYMSPEQLSLGAVDARSDLYSLGVVLYEMIAGAHPFRRESPQKTVAAILNDPPSFESLEIPEALENTLDRLLAKEAEERYLTVRALLADLRRVAMDLTQSIPAPRIGVRWLEVSLILAVIVGGFLAFFFLLPGNFPTGIGASGRPSMAILHFEDHTGLEELKWLSTGVPDMLVTGLAQAPGVDVISRQRIHEIAAKTGVDLQNPDKARLSEIGLSAGAGAIVTGSLYSEGDQLRIEVRMEDLATGRILSAHRVSGTSVFPLVDDLTQRLRAGLNLDEVPEVRRVAELTTSSLDAFRYYSQGLEASRHLRVPEARRQLEKAIEIDPGFAMAYYYLAGISERPRSRELYAKVRQHKGRLPEREQLFLEALRAQFALKTDEALKILKDLVLRYPGMEEAYHRMFAIQRRDPDRQEEALEAVEMGLRALPNSGPLHNYRGYMLLLMGRFDEAIRMFQIYVDLNPDEANSHDSLAEGLLSAGRPADAIEHYTRALQINPAFIYSYVGRSWGYAMLGDYDQALNDLEIYLDSPDGAETLLWPDSGLYQKAFMLSRLGRYREAGALITRASSGLESAQRKAMLHLFAAWWALEKHDYPTVLVETERFRKARAALEGLARVETEMVSALIAGVSQSRLGRPDAARALLEQSSFDVRKPAQRWWRQAFEGEIALAAGDPSSAGEAFSKRNQDLKTLWRNAELRGAAVNNLPFRDGLARVLKAQGKLNEAIETYRRLNIADPASKWTAVVEPRYILELARLLDEVGDAEAAKIEYRRFLQFWKDADPELPELSEARRYLSK